MKVKSVGMRGLLCMKGDPEGKRERGRERQVRKEPPVLPLSPPLHRELTDRGSIRSYKNLSQSREWKDEDGSEDDQESRRDHGGLEEERDGRMVNLGKDEMMREVKRCATLGVRRD